MSILGSMNIAKQALSVNQFAINVAANNIANVNTEGYLKQRVILSQQTGYTPVSTEKGVQIYSGGGVTISDISQYSNTALYNYYIGQNSVLTSQNELLSNSSNIENIINGLGDDSLSTAFSEFYSAVQQLSTNPSSSTLRLSFVQAAEKVADKFNSVSKNLTDARTALVGNFDEPSTVYNSQAAVLADNVNSKLKEIADINSSIIKLSGTGDDSGSLKSQRDKLLADLSSLTDFTQSENPNGTINISIAGTSVVEGAKQVGQLTVVLGNQDDPAVIQIKSMDGSATYNSDIKNKISGGQLSATLQMGSNSDEIYSYKSVMEELDKLAQAFAQEVNAVQLYNSGSTTEGTEVAMAIGLDGDNNKILIQATEALYEPSSGTVITAANITFNKNVSDNPLLIAAARVQIDDTGAPVDSAAVGDANNLTALSAIQTKGIGAFSGSTLGDALSSLVANIGIQTSSLSDKASIQADVVSSIETQYYSEGGVNINEELVDLIKYQRAYEAAARIFSVCNEMLGALVNLGR